MINKHNDASDADNIFWGDQSETVLKGLIPNAVVFAATKEQLFERFKSLEPPIAHIETLKLAGLVVDANSIKLDGAISFVTGPDYKWNIKLLEVWPDDYLRKLLINFHQDDLVTVEPVVSKND